MQKTETDYDELFSALGRGLRPNAIRKLTTLLGNREVISLAAGAPSFDTFPIEELAEISARVIRDRGRVALQYGPTRGQPGLVEAVVSTLQSRSIAAKPSELLITTGSQQGLDLVSRVLLDPGDIVMVELPSYIGGLIALHNAQAEMVGVRQDDRGLVVEELREKIKGLINEGRRVKCIYTIPNFQNPSGVTLAAERRRELVELAEEFELLIIEDDAYFDLYFAEEASRLIPLAALCPERVIYLGTFSKVLAPGLRTAWVRAPEAISAKLELAKEGADLSSSMLDQAIVIESIRAGLIERRLPELRSFYRVRCNAMLDALDRFAPEGSHWTKPIGGFFILMQLAAELNATDLLPQAIESGVAYVPGESFFVDASGANTLRLAFSKESPEAISEGVERMCRVFQRALAHGAGG
jgi:2-aminoadipate transaminase